MVCGWVLNLIVEKSVEYVFMISIYRLLIKSNYLCERALSVGLKSLVMAMLLVVSGFAVGTESNQWQAVELNVEDGLPDSTVYSMAQDEAGFMWFGTTNGLARYDGYSFKLFKHDGADASTLSNNNAGNIYLDSKNQLWIGTFGGGANLMNLNNGQLQRFPYSNTNLQEMISENVQTFFEDTNGRMWIGTGNGLYQLSEETIKYYGHNSNDSNSLSQSRVWDIEEDSKGNIWLGTSQGLSRLTIETGTFTHFELPEELTLNITSNQFRTLQMLDDVLWIGSSTGLFSFNVTSKQFNFHSSNDKIIKFNDIHVEEDNLLMASMEGIYAFNLSKNTFRTNENGFLWHPYSHLDVRQIQRDRSGLLWLATRDNGVIRIDQAGGLFELHTDYVPGEELSEKSKQVWTTVTDESNDLYLGTSDTVFKHTVNGGSERVVLDGLDVIPGIIRTIKPKASGGFWIGGSEGLFFLAADSDQAQIKNEPFDLVGIEPTDVFSVTESPDGELWLALYNVGIMHWNPEQKQAELMRSIDGHSLTDMNISVIYSDNKQYIWIGSNLAGVFRFDIESHEMNFFSHEYGDINSLSSNRVKDIFQDSFGRMWVGTARGLNQFMPETQNFKQFMQSDGLLNDSIRSIHEDSKENLWISYRFGLSKFNPKNQEINNYLLNQAISNDGFITRSSSIDANDVIYIGSSNGYYTFDPKKIKNNKQYHPPLRMTQVLLNNQPLPFSQWSSSPNNFDLFYKDRTIAFEFAALDYKSPEQIKYRYRILGLYEEWLNISSNRLIELSNLNPGDYKIEIKAFNNDGRWSEQFMSINLNVHPVWWNRGWVRILFALLIIILAVLFHQFRTNKIRKQNLLLENEVKSRTSELHDLNAQLKTAAHSDFLTNLPNRMAFIKLFEEKQSDPGDCSGCLVMADIDHFKQINDQHGHAAGDLILIKVSSMMREMIRQEDMIARWGGEEFIFYFNGKSAKEILPMIDRIRETIENTDFIYADKIIPVTLTFGICQGQSGMSLNDCIIRADEAMYEGKALGRNAVRIADSK